MKNKRIKILFILIFIAAIFFTAFILIEFHTDYLAVALSGVVMLIASYFLVDRIETDIYQKYMDEKEEINNKLDMGISKLQKLEESLLQASLQGLSDPKEKMTQLLGELDEVEGSVSQKETMDLIKNGFKCIIQYSKENARQVALNTNENTQKLLGELEKQIADLKAQLPTMVNESLQGVQNQFESLSESYLENTSLVSQRLEEIEQLTEEISRSIKE